MIAWDDRDLHHEKNKNQHRNITFLTRPFDIYERSYVET